MGTNYYAKNVPVWNGIAYENVPNLHLGKTAIGWFPIIRLHEEWGILTLNDLFDVILGESVEDEYGMRVKDTQSLYSIFKTAAETAHNDFDYHILTYGSDNVRMCPFNHVV